jgi:hypothetical protein
MIMKRQNTGSVIMISGIAKNEKCTSMSAFHKYGNVGHHFLYSLSNEV